VNRSKKSDSSASERDKIFNYAKTLFLKEGFYKITMDNLAAGLKVSKKTIYKYFSSKEVLIESIVESIKNEVSGKLDNIRESNDNAILKLINLNKLLSTMLIELDDRWINDLRIHFPSLWKEIDEFRTNRLNGTFSTIINEGQKGKLIKNIPAEMIVMIFLSTLRGVINNEFLLNSKFSYKDAIETSLRILFTGILTAKGQKVFQKSFKKV
jgi:TetR/AcrR family transcriptional regulator, biofilm operon repressor